MGQVGAWVRAWCAALLLCGIASFAHAAGPRVALVIGNSSYEQSPLTNPKNDATAVARELRRIGFEVIELQDATKREMEQGIARARQALQGRDGVGLLYFAGHGLQLEWRNFMVPVDAQLGTPRDVLMQTIDVQQVLDAFRTAGTKMNIIVLDACRDNPFGATGRGRGLAQMDAPWGTFLAYATAPGNLAEDGSTDSGHSLYTEHLVKQLREPGARIEDVFKRVRLQVRQLTQGRQIPWESTSLEDEFYFDRGLQAAVVPSASAKAQSFDREKAAWDAINQSNNVDDFYAFVKAFPTGAISELAQYRIERLQAAKVVVAPNRFGIRPDEGAERFRNGDRYEFVETDGLTGLENGRGTITMSLNGSDEVEAVGTGHYAGTARVNLAGFIVQNDAGKFDPPLAPVPQVFEVGKKFSSRSIRTSPNGSQMWVDVDGKVVAREKLATAVGMLDTYRVEVQQWLQNGARIKLTLWFEPGWGYSVKQIREVTNRGRPDIRVRELIARSRGK